MLALRNGAARLASSGDARLAAEIRRRMAQDERDENAEWAIQVWSRAPEPAHPGHAGRTMRFATSDSSTDALFDPSGLEPISVSSYRPYGVNALAFSPDSALLACAAGHTIHLADGYDGSAILKMESGAVGLGLAFSPDSKHIASVDKQGGVSLVDVQDPSRIDRCWEAHEDLATAVAFAPDGNWIVTGSWDRTIRRWRVPGLQPEGEPLGEHESGVLCLAFSPCGRFLVSGSADGTIRVRDDSTGKVSAPPLEGHSDFVRSVSFSPDGRILASGSDDRTIRLWDATTWTPVGAPIEAHGGLVMSVAFHRSGSLLASGSSDQTVRFWHVPSGETVGAPLTGPRGLIHCIAFSADGRRIAAASEDRTVRIWANR